MRKKSLLLLLGLIVVASSAFSLRDWQTSIYNQIRSETIKGLKDSFHVDVSVGKVTGPVVGQVIFEDVRIPGYATAKQVNVNYDLVKFALYRDIVPAITTITIIGGEFDVVRRKSGALDVADLLPPADPNAPPAPPFRAKLVFKDCRANYRDEAGFRVDHQTFMANLTDLDGSISFRRKDRISFNLNASSYDSLKPSLIRFSGSLDQDSGKFTLNLTAKDLDAGKWGNYCVPLDLLDFTGGSADLVIKLSQAKTAGWPLSLVGNFNFKSTSARIGDYALSEVNGSLAMADDSLALKDLELKINEVPLAVSGRYNDFSKHQLDLNAQLKQAELNDLIKLFPETRQMDLHGQADASVVIKGEAANAVVDGKININNGRFYNQAFAGETQVTYNNNTLGIDISRLDIYSGRAAGSCTIDFNPDTPTLALNASLKDLDLASLAQNSPGIVGRATGQLQLQGPLNRLEAELSAGLHQAMLLGQPMEDISAVLIINEGNIDIEIINLTSKTASLHSFGRLSRDLELDLRTQAQGIELSGEGIFGPMQATVNMFRGDISAKLDEAFFSSPLKHLEASGVVKLSKGVIGQQKFDLAQGQISLGEGLISINDVIIAQNESIIQAKGQTGIGHETNLQVRGSRLDLADLKILNYLLPEEAQDPKGRLDISVFITGELSKETRIDSFDPLLGLCASGEALITETELAEVPISSAQLSFLWQDKRLNFPAGQLFTPDSHLNFSLVYDQNDQLDGQASGSLDLYEFRRFTEMYGRLSGRIGLNLTLKGRPEQPNLGLSFWFEDFRFNRLTFDQITGGLSFAGDRLVITRPVLLTKDKSRYQVFGQADFSPLKQQRPEAISLDLDVKILEADLGDIIKLSEQIRAEVSRKLYTTSVSGLVQLDLASLELASSLPQARQGQIKLYDPTGGPDSFLQNWQSVAAQEQQLEAEASSWGLGGRTTGLIMINGTVGSLEGRFDGEVKQGHYVDFNFDSLKARASLSANRINLDSLEVNKDWGKLTASGWFSFNNKLSLALTAQNMPLDIMKILFNKEFDGNFNMRASVSGTLNDPDLKAVFSGNSISLAEVKFDKVAASINKTGSHVLIEQIDLTDQGQNSTVNGTIDLSRNGQVSLEADLKDDGIGLFNLLTDELKWRQGQGRAKLSLSGSLDDLSINGRIELRDATAYARLIDSEIGQISGEAVLVNSWGSIAYLTGIWQGKTSRGFPNFIGLAGKVQLNRILAASRMVELDLNFTPTYFWVDLPRLYNGYLEVKSARLKGPLYFDFSRGPTLSGTAEINNAVITLSQGSKKRTKVFPLNFDLLVDLNKNVYASMGDVATLDLSNIFMNLELTGPQLKISGDLEYPSLLGKITLKRGTVTIFNREFSLLNTTQQEKYYSFNSEKILENTALFTGEEGREGLMPDISITAKVDVENPEKQDDKVIYRKVTVLSRLSGVIGSPDKDRGLKISFDSFVENDNKEIVPGTYSDEEIKVMLLPDFIKSLAGVSEADNSNVDTNVVVADYISSRLQTVVFRSLERELEQKLGLESLTLEYNFGKEVRQAMGVSETRVIEGDKPDWRVGFVKGLFDRFYLEINYSQYGAQAENPMEETFDYQLTYKLSPIWSIIYYREPTSPQDLTTGYQKITLKAGFSFW